MWLIHRFNQKPLYMTLRYWLPGYITETRAEQMVQTLTNLHIGTITVSQEGLGNVLIMDISEGTPPERIFSMGVILGQMIANTQH